MRYFAYAYSETEIPKRNGTTHKTVRIYRISENVPKLVADYTDTFVGEEQLVLETMERNRLLPKRAFVRSKFGSFEYSMRELYQHGIACIKRIS